MKPAGGSVLLCAVVLVPTWAADPVILAHPKYVYIVGFDYQHRQ
jgi:hypothetical protein